jgi:hypothetical protein
MKENPRTYKFEAGQKCSDYNRDNLADVEVVFCFKWEYSKRYKNL